MKTVTVTEYGWFLFCPIWMAEHDGDAMPIPRFRLYWLFECALWCQQAINWCLSWIAEDAGGFVFVLHPCAPREIRIP